MNPNIIDNINNNINNELIKNIVNKCINSIFINLITSDKILIVNNLSELIIYIINKFNINEYLEQLKINNYQDVYSLLILLMPFYELNASKNIKTLNELFKNNNNSAKKLSSSYYVDHLNSDKLISDSDYLNKYFENTVNSIKNTIDKVSTKLLPNWKNIFPYDMTNYKKSDIYLYYLNIFKNRQFNYNNSGFIYGVIYKFLYIDIKDIKWMIFDKNENNLQVSPYIFIVSRELQISKIINEPWDLIDKIKQQNLNINWINFLNSSSNNDIIKSLLLFYLRWEYDQEKLSSLKIDKNCSIILKKKFKLTSNENDIDKNDETVLTDQELSNCIESVKNQIQFKNIYNYIYECMHRFKYTWYAYYCLDDNHNILNINDFYNKYEKELPYLKFEEKSQPAQFNKFKYVTLKNVYNFFKSFLHNNKDNEYKLHNKSYEFDNIDLDTQNIIIDRLNMKNISSWFKITTNLNRIYNDNKVVNEIYNYIVESLNTSESTFFIRIIFETLVYNGMLTYFKYNPKVTDNNIIPNKNKEFSKWKNHILENIKLIDYENAYHFFTNKKYKNHENSLELIKNSLWYTNFGADWIAQIQIYHHFINQRVIYVTGATGAGKSTVAPFLLLYAIKMINYKNDAKVVCTVPRIQPAKDNSKMMSHNIGIPILKENSINYIQYETATNKIIDNLYHPALILSTDGLLYQRIKSNYVLKNKSRNTFNNINMYDMILVDEAHEHNVYMDMILTLCRFGVYINNQVPLGIISATMDEDELIYRKYFEMIDDNMKWPIRYQDKYDRKYLDRRIHLSVPFGGMNFDVKEIIKINSKPEDILKDIIIKTTTGDILLFLIGQSDINKAVKTINENTPGNILAIPFYSELDPKLLDRVKEIADKNIRKLFRYDKNKYGIKDMDNIPKDELRPENTYSRFIIIATNIAEASITINSLEYVIDTGKQKVNIYNENKDIAELKTIEISKPNQKQRKGRVGRVKPGTVYYTYDINKLPDRVIYKICIENIEDMLYGLYKTYSSKKYIDENNDPNKVTDSNKIVDFLKDQYLLSNGKIKSLKNKDNIIYPDENGRYERDILIDDNGIFYIIHPDEDKFERNINLVIEKIKEKPYENKVKKIFDFGINKGFLDRNYNITQEYNLYGNTLQYFSTFFDKITTKHIKLLYEVLCNYDINSEMMNKIILFVIFSLNNYDLDINKKIIGNADFLVKSSIIPIQYYNYLDYNVLETKSTTDSIQDMIRIYIENKFKNSTNIKNDILKILQLFYRIKLIFKNIKSNINKEIEKNEKNELNELNELSNLYKNLNKNIINIKYYSLYDQLCYFILKNFQSYLLIKIPNSDIYINYNNIDVNQVFSLNKKEIRVYQKNINRSILAFNINTPLLVTNIMWIPDYLLDKLNIKKNIYNKKINIDKLKSIYDNNYDTIKQKIEKVSLYLKNI